MATKLAQINLETGELEKTNVIRSITESEQDRINFYKDKQLKKSKIFK